MARSGGIAGKIRKSSRTKVTMLLGYLLSTTPVMAYDVRDEVQLAQNFMPLSQENQGGYLQESPYLNRPRGSVAPRRHPAEPLPSAAELRRKEIAQRLLQERAIKTPPVLAPIVDTAPVAAVAAKSAPVASEVIRAPIVDTAPVAPVAAKVAPVAREVIRAPIVDSTKLAPAHVPEPKVMEEVISPQATALEDALVKEIEAEEAKPVATPPVLKAKPDAPKFLLPLPLKERAEAPAAPKEALSSEEKARNVMLKSAPAPSLAPAPAPAPARVSKPRSASVLIPQVNPQAPLLNPEMTKEAMRRPQTKEESAKQIEEKLRAALQNRMVREDAPQTPPVAAKPKPEQKPTPTPTPKPAMAPKPKAAEPEHILEMPKLKEKIELLAPLTAPAEKPAAPKKHLLEMPAEKAPSAMPPPPIPPVKKPLLGDELPSEMQKPKSGEGADSTPQSRAVNRINAAMNALRQKILPVSEQAEEAPTLMMAPDPSEVAVKTPEVLVSADEMSAADNALMRSVTGAEEAPKKLPPQVIKASLPTPQPKIVSVDVAPKSKNLPVSVQQLVEQLKQQAKERSLQEEAAPPQMASDVSQEKKAQPSGSMSFLEELQSVVGMIASDEKEDEKPQSEMLKPMSQSSGVQDLTTQWKKREVAAESADRLMPMQLSGRIQPLNAILQAEGEDGKTLTLVNEISDADSALLQNASGQTITHEPPMKYEVVRQSLPDSPALPQPRELPAEREVALVVPAETRVKLPVREIPIDLKTGDKPFSKWKEPTPSGEQLKGKLQLVNAEEEMPIEALKVSKITKMIGGGTEVMNAPKPEMVEAQLPVAVPVYANAPTQQVREGDKLIKTLMLTPAPSIVPIKTVAPNNDPAPSLMPPALPEDEVAYQPRLSSETKSLLSSLPANAGKPKYDHNGMPLDMAHSGGASSGLGKKTPDIHKAQGVRIDVKNPDLDVNQYLEQAYEAQLKEDLGTAMDRYQAIVEAYPDNNEAKFGLATTYHRMGELLMARNLYAEIIQSEPGNLEALNNLLVLVSQESPEEALAELQKLEKRNPYFSPIPAQMAALYAKNRDFGSAVESIQRAMDIDPRNLAYRYNAAVLMDRAGRRQDAIDLYTSLKRSHERGLDVPADMAAIQERLTFLLSNRG